MASRGFLWLPVAFRFVPAPPHVRLSVIHWSSPMVTLPVPPAPMAWPAPPTTVIAVFHCFAWLPCGFPVAPRGLPQLPAAFLLHSRFFPAFKPG